MCFMALKEYTIVVIPEWNKMKIKEYKGTPKRMLTRIGILYRFLLPATLLKTLSKSPLSSKLLPVAFLN